MVQKWNLGDIAPSDRPRHGIPKDRPSAASDGTVQHIRKIDTARPRMGDMRRPSQARQPLSQSRAPERRAPEPQYENELEENEGEASRGPFIPRESQGERIPIGNMRAKRMKTWVLGILFFAVAIGIGFATTILLGGAEVTVYPKHREVAVAATFEAKLKPGAGDLGYELLSLAEEGERRVTATGQEKVSTKATGKITIYNALSTQQRLIKNTRFESTDGFIFRVNDSVVVPPAKKKSDGNMEPGSITTNVFADGTGETYNVAPTRFTVPGLKGGDQFDKIYAESKEMFSGGFDGMKYIIDENELSTTRQELHTELRDKLLARLKTERPNGFIFYEPSITFAYNSLPATDAGAQTVVLKEQARLLAPLFKSDKFAEHIAKNSVPGYEREPIRIEDSSTLSFSYPATTTEDISTKDSLSFKLNGKANLIWVFDAEKLRNDLVGLGRSALTGVLSGYPSIEKAEAKIRPVWKKKFPTSLDDIRIIEVLQQ